MSQGFWSVSFCKLYTNFSKNGIDLYCFIFFDDCSLRMCNVRFAKCKNAVFLLGSISAIFHAEFFGIRRLRAVFVMLNLLAFGGYAQHLICSQKKIPKQVWNDKTFKLDIQSIAKTEIFLQALYVPGGQSGAGQAEK